MRIPADRIIGLTTSPARSANCSTRPPGADDGLVQIHLRLRQRGFGARPFRRQQRRHPYGGGLLVCGGDVDSGLALIHQHLQFFDVALGQMPGSRRCSSLFTSSSSLAC
jgi:hypothetical protein